MIHIDNEGKGYMHGNECQAIGADVTDSLIEFIYLEGTERDTVFVQPMESVFTYNQELTQC